MLNQAQVDQVLDSLSEGRDIIQYKEEARAFLHDLLMEAPPSAWKLVLPIGRALLSYLDWREVMTPQSVMEFCMAHNRLTAAMILAPLRSDDCDPEAEYLTGLMHCYRDSRGKRSLHDRRPDLAPTD